MGRSTSEGALLATVAILGLATLLAFLVMVHLAVAFLQGSITACLDSVGELLSAVVDPIIRLVLLMLAAECLHMAFLVIIVLYFLIDPIGCLLLLVRVIRAWPA
jgi:hypothetical protein